MGSARGLNGPQPRPLRLRHAREICSQPVDSDDFGETIARFAAPAERSFLERRGAAKLQMRRRALMIRAQRLVGEHCGRRTTGTSSTSLGSCAASDFVELLGATRAETSGLARCHGAAGELQNGCVQNTGCLKVILERTMASVPDWSEMRHSAPSRFFNFDLNV
jgi:hypothetical protein